MCLVLRGILFKILVSKILSDQAWIISVLYVSNKIRHSAERNNAMTIKWLKIDLNVDDQHTLKSKLYMKYSDRKKARKLKLALAHVVFSRLSVT